MLTFQDQREEEEEEDLLDDPKLKTPPYPKECL